MTTSLLPCNLSAQHSSPENHHNTSQKNIAEFKKNSEQSATLQALRNTCWEIGKRFPLSFHQEGITLLAVYPHLGFIQWHINEGSIRTLREQYGKDFDRNAKLIIRVYDVTNIDFDGFNANRQFDISVDGFTGSYYLKIDNYECNLMVEAGYRFNDSRFVACARSNIMYFDRPRRSSLLKTSGLYVNQAFTRMFSVENVACAPVFDGINRLLEQLGDIPLSVAVFLNECAVADPVNKELPVTIFVENVLAKCKTMGAAPVLFTPEPEELSGIKKLSLMEKVHKSSIGMLEKFLTAHNHSHFECIQCHDWYSAPAALQAAFMTGLPLVLVLHSVEPERSGEEGRSVISREIESWERQAINRARSVLTVKESTREAVIAHYGKAPDFLAVVPDTLSAVSNVEKGSDYVRCRYGLTDQKPVFLFAGEIAHHSGADLWMNAIPGVCREFSYGQFVFAGDGPLKQDLQRQAMQSGVNDRCRFPGDIPSELFGQLLAACDIVVIPARRRQDSALVKMALSAGKQVIATHQSGLSEIRHGVNGLLVYDNPGSITWGVREMLADPLRALRLSMTDDSSLLHTTECIAAMYITHWALAAVNTREVSNG